MPSPHTLIYNDKVIQAENHSFPSFNRAFRYGDGLFETILIRGGKAVFVEHHLARMLHGMSVLGFEFDADEWRTKMEEVIAELEAANRRSLPGGNPGYGKIRVVVFRGGGGTFKPESDVPEFYAEAQQMTHDPWQHTGPLRIGVYHDVPVVHSPLSAVKSLNSLPYILASKYARAQHWDDALLRSVDGSFAESTSGNLFLVRAASLVTPWEKSGCLPGTMRVKVLEAARALGLQVRERSVVQQDLESADEVFLTNAIGGLRSVKEIVGHGRYNGFSTREAILEEILGLLN